jgi:hypothetical protein
MPMLKTPSEPGMKARFRWNHYLCPPIQLVEIHLHVRVPSFTQGNGYGFLS